MNAADVKAALRDRHPAVGQWGEPGPWTVLEEYRGIDVLALSAWSSPPTSRIGVRYPIVGYEVKVSRSDYRRELRSPGKRADAVSFTNAFYMAVPAGLLKPEEIEWPEPEWVLDTDSWEREPCRYAINGPDAPAFSADPGHCYRGKRQKIVEGPLREHVSWREHEQIRCEGCNGRGYSDRSRVEREAPTLWVPADCGLVIVDEKRGARVVKKAPLRPTSPRLRFSEDVWARSALAELVRWVSYRPDPRHAEGRAQAGEAVAA